MKKSKKLFAMNRNDKAIVFLLRKLTSIKLKFKEEHGTNL